MIIFSGMKKGRFRLILWLGFLLILLAYFFKIKQTINEVKIINQKNSVQNTID